MGAKSKPQETLAADAIGADGGERDDRAGARRRRRRAARAGAIEGGADAAEAIVDFLAERQLL